MARLVDLAGVLGLEDFLEAAVDNTNRAASMALNDVLQGPRGLGVYRDAIKKQINFPPDYLNSDRFGVDQRATPERLQASIVARQRPTSLARFVVGGGVPGQRGVSVKVKANGGAKSLRSGFLVRLRNGTNLDGSNIGLAVRLKPGQTLNKTDQSRMVHLDANVVLLYGPSIDQVLNTSVADAETPEVVENVATEFFRQFARLQDGK